MERTQLNFGDALNVLKVGGKVARKGWNGKGMFLYLTKGSNVPFDNLKKETKGHLKDSAVCQPKYNGAVCISSHIDMKAADGSITIGWAPSQVDMLAEDWEVIG